MNLEEEQRTMLRSRHHPQASSSRVPAVDQHTATTKAPVYPPGSRFLPTDLGLVRVHLKDMVEKQKQSIFITITTLDVYDADPWLLNHVHNDLFRRNEWYYFVPRIERGDESSKRTVPARGESEGGTWKSNNKKVEIMDKDKKVEGYMQNLVYNKNVNGEGEAVPTDWHMTEYCLHKDVHEDLVLCHIRGKLEKKVKDGFVAQVPQVDNNILLNQVQDEEAGFANGIEKEMLQGDNGDAIQQQDIDSLRPLQSNDKIIKMSSSQVQKEQEEDGLTGSANETDTRMLDGEHGDVTRQQQQQEMVMML